MITEDYVSYEIAKLLKEKGFNEPCLYYYKDKVLMFSPFLIGRNLYQTDTYFAPTHQMAMKWLREKHIVIVIHPEYFNCETVSYWGVDIWADDNYENLSGDYPKYEEAVEAALKYCLEKLI